MALQSFFRYDTWIKTALGPAVPGAQVYVCLQPANIASAPPSPLALIYSDPLGLVPISQPILSDGFGHANFYALPGLYTVVIAFSGLIQQVYTDQSLGGVGSGGAGGTSLVLQVNGTPNANQLLLNLQGQNSVAISDTGNGTVNITGAVFQTNGVPNTLQSILNLKSGNNVTLSADSFGGVTIAAQGASFSGSGAYFFGPGITDNASVFGLLGSSVSASSANGSLFQNTVIVHLFQLLTTFTISKATTKSASVSGGVTATFGIYSVSGNKLVDAGQFTCLSSSGVQTHSFGAVTLPPGTYYHAQATTSSGTVSFFGVEVASGAQNPDTMACWTTNATRAAKAANVLSAGVLPATLGALTPFTPTSNDGICCPLYE